MKFQDLQVYIKSVDLAMEIFELSKAFPKSETYALTDQIRQSSRSVSANIAEAYRKRRYPKHFTSKMTDSDAENSETQTWLEFALKCNYIEAESYQNLIERSNEVGKLINFMISNPEKFGVKI
ncbi:four helix bundle protein [Aureitalea sp. L0-47]|uniref:four helix bundle protein n=1 Tax=Aureitalea sp. L0-47 TaxID=2816962 RepID=UPI002238CF9A|nr:four helix bundle protein [Aureitalea sp. L0-47]MCW5519630.1 four helix bundle protein [Aureitalea sp. L0-47]